MIIYIMLSNYVLFLFFLQVVFVYGVLVGRKGYGSIFVVVFGNGGYFKDNCNFDGYVNFIYIVIIGLCIDEVLFI